MKEYKGSFPENFYWGTAISSYQTEGNNDRSDWWEYERASKIGNGVHSGKATNHYECYEEDFDLVQSLHNNAFRFSLEWSRIEPQSGQFDMTAIEYYRSYILSLRRRGIEPFITLWHYTLPVWLAERGGWLHKDAHRYFVRYVKFVMENLIADTDVKYIITMNEPLVYTLLSYVNKKYPPQQASIISAVRVVRKLIKAHRMSYRAIGKIKKGMRVGIAKNNTYFDTLSRKRIDRCIVFVAGYVWNRYFLNRIRRHSDFIGINYYFHNRISFRWRKLLHPRTIFNCNENEDTSDMGWEIYPAGMYYVLMEAKRYQKPIFILENGVADAKDRIRPLFIMEHLKYIWKAMRDGADVRGYFYWSLIDNFDWADGFEPRFGLFEVDYNDYSRHPRVSARVYADICRYGKIV